jgi:hypothetical protein
VPSGDPSNPQKNKNIALLLVLLALIALLYAITIMKLGSGAAA